MGQKTRNFFLKLLSRGAVESSRRFVTLVISGIFLLSCLTGLILLIALFVSTNKLQNINIEALRIVTDLLKDMLKYEMLIVIGGLGFIAVPDFVRLLMITLKPQSPYGYEDSYEGPKNLVNPNQPD